MIKLDGVMATSRIPNSRIWVQILVGLPLLIGCSESLSPERCRYLGVNVQDDDTVTGLIIEENVSDQRTVQARCKSPFQYREGCAIPVGPNEYIVWRIDDPKVRDHEKCHALYEERRHL